MVKPSKIVLASSNAGKLKEFCDMLADFQIEVVPQSQFNVIDAEETGLSFVENAIIKARHACQQTGLPALADDSGLEVDALNGAPGIYSARYSGPNSSDLSNVDKLLLDLQAIPEPLRTGRYQCVLVFMRHALDPTPLICQGSWEGKLLFEPKGQGGFGYDPIFYCPKLGLTAAEMSAETKHSVSHRGLAMNVLVSQLNRWLGVPA
ncbi:RdgB/HAM1 family non-canonical purine NTP pyrophosphatase [Nitrincola alkalisediminis]|uniref:RdgB/HAM1 family non-canonical purine NTP pyrophosphatase n=1 Tax=Nitrincola alkalisediminis TaxID=1366656 RepID=UPI001CA992FA|nr:RdgB/HAM1 family non-canonical purine NTP pyrophosphatase [Nitrincola alkalisediminis]